MTTGRIGRTTVPMPPLFKGKLHYTMLSAELTRAGIDARREDGSHVIVMWREIVGAAVRRLPADLDGIVFVDIVSTVGQTLRLLPWTRVTGDVLDGEHESDARPRSLLQRIVERCPGAILDPTSRKFLDGLAPAAQLPDAATLAAHDARLA